MSKLKQNLSHNCYEQRQGEYYNQLKLQIEQIQNSHNQIVILYLYSILENQGKLMLDKDYTKYLTSHEIQEAQSAFKLFDQDGSGSISIKEFDQILKTLGQNLNEDELDEIVEKIDQDGNGFIDFEQFLYLVAPKIINKRTQKDFIGAFRILDYKNKGELGLSELMKANLVAGANLSIEQVQQILSYVSQKFKGKLGIDEMLTMLQRKPQIVSDDEL